jgi:hypothetical protein
VAAALVLLAGGAVAFASQSIDKDGAAQPTNVPAPPPPPVTLLPPTVAITRSASIDLTAVAPANLRHDQQYTVRIFVNAQPTGRMDLPSDDQFALKNVPLAEGTNTIQATLVGDGGESAMSTAVVVTRDDVPPTMKILQPTDTVYTADEMLQGRTEAGADLHISDAAGHEIASTISPDGRFSAALSLHVGSNALTLVSTDAAGNKTTSHVTIERASSAASIDLSVTPGDIYQAELPATVELSAVIRDELGHQVADGTTVIFGVSPPDQTTATYNATTTNGRARYPALSIDPGDASGQWLVTALVTLPSGIELRANATLTVLDGAPKSPGQH